MQLNNNLLKKKQAIPHLIMKKNCLRPVPLKKEQLLRSSQRVRMMKKIIGKKMQNHQQRKTSCWCILFWVGML
jgi:hypothetical protein